MGVQRMTKLTKQSTGRKARACSAVGGITAKQFKCGVETILGEYAQVAVKDEVLEGGGPGHDKR